MSDLVVSTRDTRPFFDKVMEHAVGYNLLGQEQRAQLAEDCNNFHPDVCSTFGLNIFDIGQTLEAAALVKQMLSVKLEGLSGGNLTLAVKALQKYPIKNLLTGIIQEVHQEIKRVVAVVKTTQRFTTAFGYNVIIFRGRPQKGRRTNLIPHLDCANALLSKETLGLIDSSACLLGILKLITSHYMLQALRDDITDLEQEMAVSSKFLPWDTLKQEAKFQPATTGKDEYAWTAETMMATLCVILVTGGSNRFVSSGTNQRAWGTVYPQDMLEHLKSSLAFPKKFRQQAVAGLSDFLKAKATVDIQGTIDPSKMPSEAEMDILQTLLDSALDSLLPPHTHLPPKAGLGFWLDRLHVSIEEGEFKSRKDKHYRPAYVRVHQSEKILRALDKDTSSASIDRMLQRLSWEEAERNGVADELIDRLDAQVLLPHLPMFVEMINRILRVWKTPNGTSLWPKEQRQRLVRRALEGGSDLFWSKLDRWALEDLAAVNSEFTTRVEERYAQAFERTRR